MGFLSRFLGPPSQPRVRPAARRASKRTTLQRITQSLTRNSRSVDGKKLVTVYHHGTCTVNHRSKQAASRCRRTS
jgi:D-serine deaminase-like pyridoxal phosphate-dependent protein